MKKEVEKKVQDVAEECPLCGARYAISLRTVPFEGKYHHVAIHVDSVECYSCESCGEEFFNKAQSEALDSKLKSAARERLQVLSPERIAGLRRRLGLSQEELESLLGLGQKVVTRWETGRVIPGKATDDLLRLMERMPSVIQALREIRQESQRGEA